MDVGWSQARKAEFLLQRTLSSAWSNALLLIKSIRPEFDPQYWRTLLIDLDNLDQLKPTARTGSMRPKVEIHQSTVKSQQYEDAYLLSYFTMLQNVFSLSKYVCWSCLFVPRANGENILIWLCLSCGMFLVPVVHRTMTKGERRAKETRQEIASRKRARRKSHQRLMAEKCENMDRQQKSEILDLLSCQRHQEQFEG